MANILKDQKGCSSRNESSSKDRARVDRGWMLKVTIGLLFMTLSLLSTPIATPNSKPHDADVGIISMLTHNSPSASHLVLRPGVVDGE